MELTSGVGTGPTTTVSTSHQRSEGGESANAKAATRKAEASDQAGEGGPVDASGGAGRGRVGPEGVGGVLERRHADGEPNDLRHRGPPLLVSQLMRAARVFHAAASAQHGTVGEGPLPQQIGALLPQPWRRALSPLSYPWWDPRSFGMWCWAAACGHGPESGSRP
jgi:hypothetical protein